ncbi:MAG: hypothetical protein JNL21_05940 [Myxococcales bacterium]|nr:hypothetical protein [Myxococcales bacterium]
MRPSANVALALGVLFLVHSRTAAAEEKAPPPIPQHRIVYDNLVGARLNPLGLEDLYNISYRARLYASDSIALRDNAFAVGLSPTLSPAISRFGGHVEIKPLTVLSLSAGFYQVGYTSSFGLLQSFPDAEVDYSDSRLSERRDAGLNYPTNGYEVTLRALAVAKFWQIAVRSDTNAFYTDISLRDGDTVYYNQRNDLLLPDRGWGLTSDEDLAWVSEFGLVAGARFSVGQGFVDGDGPGPIMRLGPLLAYTFFDEPGSSFNKPTIIGLFQWWLQHPSRTGQDVTQALPQIALAFRFEGELWRSD